MIFDSQGNPFKKKNQSAAEKMFGVAELSDEQRAIVEAARTPGFGTPGMTFKQKIRAAAAIFKKLKEGKKMTGARLLAADYIRPLMTKDAHVYDFGCGDAWVSEEFPHTFCYHGFDVKSGGDFTSDRFWEETKWAKNDPTVILSIFALQHLLSEEARVWTLLRRIAKPETKFVYVGRYSIAVRREMNREDPMNCYSFSALEGLATASGWKVTDFKTWQYNDDSYRTPIRVEECNAFAATLVPLE